MWIQQIGRPPTKGDISVESTHTIGPTELTYMTIQANEAHFLKDKVVRFLTSKADKTS